MGELFATGTELTEDLMLNILSRLNCEDIVPMFLVSRNWQRSFLSDVFLQLQHNQDAIKSTRIILTQVAGGRRRIFTRIHMFDVKTNNIYCVHPINSSPFQIHEMFIGSSIRLMLVRREFPGQYYSLSVFNPTTKDVLEINDFLNNIVASNAS